MRTFLNAVFFRFGSAAETTFSQFYSQRGNAPNTCVYNEMSDSRWMEKTTKFLDLTSPYFLNPIHLPHLTSPIRPNGYPLVGPFVIRSHCGGHNSFLFEERKTEDLRRLLLRASVSIAVVDAVCRLELHLPAFSWRWALRCGVACW